MSSYVSTKLRQAVIDRAGNCCEYCLLSQESIFLSFEVDHIISEKHGGETSIDNLCFSCPDCNRFKGTDIGSIDRVSKQIARLFDPRSMKWGEHFHLNNFVIDPLTDIGRVTERILQLNRPERIADRKLYARTGAYPCSAQAEKDS